MKEDFFYESFVVDFVTYRHKCFIPNFKLKYKNSENIKEGRVNTVISTDIKSNVGCFFWDTQYCITRYTEKYCTLSGKHIELAFCQKKF